MNPLKISQEDIEDREEIHTGVSDQGRLSSIASVISCKNSP